MQSISNFNILTHFWDVENLAWDLSPDKPNLIGFQIDVWICVYVYMWQFRLLRICLGAISVRITFGSIAVIYNNNLV